MADASLSERVASAPSRWFARAFGSEMSRTLVITSVSLLVCVGTVMVFSAAAFHRAAAGDPFYFLRKQLAWVAIASLVGIFFYQIDYRLLRRVYWPALVAATLLLALVLLPQVGTLVNQSRRWIRLGGGLQFQPSELAKLVVVLFVAGYLANDPRRPRQFFRGFCAVSFCILPAFIFILLEPDFGTAVFVLGLAMLLLLLGGVPILHMLTSVVVFLPFIALAAYSRWEQVTRRVFAFLEPEQEYQMLHSLTALGTGGWTGVGLGESGQRLQFLPEAHTDFILAIIGEETGLVGCTAILLLFVCFIWGGVGIVWRARDYFGFLLGAGIIFGIGVQAFLNVAVVTASAPTKGIALPFVTFGGSGLVIAMAQIGLLLSIERVWREEARSDGSAGAEAG